jgi:hypothetical protein
MAAPQRMQTGVFWTLPLDMMHSEIRFPLLPIMLQTVTNPADHGLDSCFEHDLVRKPVSTFRDHALKADGKVREPTVGRKRR